MPTDADIFACLTEQGSECALPDAWNRLKCSKAFLSLGQDHPALLARLSKDFSTDELVSAGVAILDEGGMVSLAPGLRMHGEHVLALHGRANEPPFNLIAGNQL